MMIRRWICESLPEYRNHRHPYCRAGFLSLTEIALAGARKVKLKICRPGDERAQKVLDLQEKPRRFLCTSQIGLNAVAILQSFRRRRFPPFISSNLFHASMPAAGRKRPALRFHLL